MISCPVSEKDLSKIRAQAFAQAQSMGMSPKHTPQFVEDVVQVTLDSQCELDRPSQAHTRSHSQAHSAQKADGKRTKYESVTRAEPAPLAAV